MLRRRIAQRLVEAQHNAAMLTTFNEADMSKVIALRKLHKEEFNDKYKKIVDSIEEKDFKSTATIYSSSDTSQFEGKIGWVSKNDVSEEIYQQIYKLKINEFSKPIKIGAGFILINLDAVKEEKQKINLEEKFAYIINKETNRQLNQYSTIHYKKIERQNFVYEN